MLPFPQIRGDNSRVSVLSQPEFPFCFPGCEPLYLHLPLLRSFSAFVPEPKNRTRPARPLPEPKGHDLPHFEAISQTPLPQLPLRRPDWFRLAAAPIRPAAAKPESAAACLRTGAASDGSLPTIASSSGHALPTGRRSSPAAAASWSTTMFRFPSAAPAAATGCP